MIMLLFIDELTHAHENCYTNETRCVSNAKRMTKS